MEKLTSISGIAAPMLEDDIDTDVIFPARYLLMMDKEGLGQYLFHDRRHGSENGRNSAFVLDQPRYKNACILVTGANFGCGSSREHAVWALKGAGIDCIIAPGFGEIFYSNCFKNGLLPITLPFETVSWLATQAGAVANFEIDLLAQSITVGGQTAIGFTIDEQRRQSLLNGRDEIDEILMDPASIEQFEDKHQRMHPWLFSPAYQISR
jgi:3-isopropylmalate/(R)-2-methylmalate dehydratase small subunit